MFRVEWQPSATEDLAALTMLHLNRWSDIDAAEHDLDYKLRAKPLHFSQPVSEGLRRAVSEPLAFYFSIDGNQVDVVAIGWTE
jgi:hypothetical protein